MAFLLLAAACTGPAIDDPPPGNDAGVTPSPTAVYLTPAQHLTRASLALRGVRPSVEDLQAVDTDPQALGDIVDRYLDTPEFGATIREMHNEALMLRVELAQFTFPGTATFTGHTAFEVNDSVFSEPLRLIEDIVMTDQPYTKVVTADYTMSNATNAQIWGYSRTGAPAAWTRTPFPDARGAAGVLGIEAIYHRHESAGFNYNRGRANLISSAFLCHDYAHADIVIDTSVDLSDPEVVANAVVENSSCAGCHQTLDPLASYLFPFRSRQPINQLSQGTVDYPIGGYRVPQETQWRTTNKRPPMFFGTAADKLPGLGQAIAADPRFAKCTATRFASYLTQVPTGDLDGRWIAHLQATLEDNNFGAKRLVKEIVMSDQFRLLTDTEEARAEDVVGMQKLRPAQLSRMIRDATGFQWTTPNTARIRNLDYGQPDLLDSDLIGFKVLAGGVDGFFVTTPVHTTTTTSSLVAKALASSAADFVVERDATVAAADRTLFVKAAIGATDEAVIRDQLAHLHARLYGELVDAASVEVDETFALFTAAKAAANNNQRRAWKLTLVGMLSDVRALTY
ncbi:MAG: DUF1585 domain-containing protein [Kofleriaceae bacterium]